MLLMEHAAGIMSHISYYSHVSKSTILLFAALNAWRCMVMLQAHGEAEGQELSVLSTSERSRAHWDHELMLSLSSASDPLLIPPHT